MSRPGAASEQEGKPVDRAPDASTAHVDAAIMP